MKKNRSYKAQKLIDRMGQKLVRQMVGSLSACVHCGMCTESCHYVLANPGDPTFAPAYKADRIRKIFKRHFDVGLTDGYITPWIVTSLSNFGLSTAMPASIPLPNMEPLSRYGFKYTLEIEPREFEKNKILRIVYPNRKTAKKRITPDIHFKLIMDAIIANATKRYGSDVQQAYCARNPAPVSHVTLDLAHKAPKTSNHSYWETLSAGNYKSMDSVQ